MLWVQSHTPAVAAPTSTGGGSCSARVLLCCQRPWLPYVRPTLLKKQYKPQRNMFTESIEQVLRWQGAISMTARLSNIVVPIAFSAKPPRWSGKTCVMRTLVLALTTLTPTPILSGCAAGVDVLPVFRLLCAQVAASCNGLAHALELRQGLKYVRHCRHR